MRINPAKRSLLNIVIAGLIFALVLLIAPKLNPVSRDVTDVSWPNCSLQSVNAQWGIVGVTGGLDLRPNRCLASETGWFNNYALYMNTGYPGVRYADKFASSPRLCAPSNEACLAYNYGYNASLYAIKYAASKNVHSNLWWLDVETDNSWSTRAAFNRDSLQGSIDALRQNVILTKVGIYSYPAQWKVITDNWHNGLPAWVATGSTVKSAASKACKGQSFDGGPIWLGQYTPSLDVNQPCNQQFFQTIL